MDSGLEASLARFRLSHGCSKLQVQGWTGGDKASVPSVLQVSKLPTAVSVCSIRAECMSVSVGGCMQLGCGQRSEGDMFAGRLLVVIQGAQHSTDCSTSASSLVYALGADWLIGDVQPYYHLRP